MKLGVRGWRRVRRGLQLVALLAFLALLVYAHAQRPKPLWADLFSRLDPLLMLAGSLAGRVLLAGLALASLTVVLTLLFGRAWCGWLCPLGTLLEWLGPRHSRALSRRPPPESWRAIKVLLLVAIVVSAALGLQTLLILDPITILNRTVTTAVWPGLRHLVVAAETTLYGLPVLWGPLDALHNTLVQPVFQELQPVFGLAPLLALLFAVLVAFNWWAERFWCRYLCPLGGLLGLISKAALLRREVSGDCVQCARCTAGCPTGTIDPEEGFRSDPAECIVCLDCLVDCPQESVGFRWQIPGWRLAPTRAYDPSRRQVLVVGGAALAGVALAGVEPVTKRQPATMIRPPGAAAVDFDSLCIRCGACLRACPTQGLQPSLMEGGVQNVLTPRLVPRLGPCLFSCNACGQVCPTGAIPRLGLTEKQATAIGLARIDRDRCLPWAYDTPCIVCEEMCPVPEKAIELEEVEVTGAAGRTVLLQRPTMVGQLCIGCGICEFHCPAAGEAAIRVYALPGEEDAVPTGV
jgi:MauM/NapG family ferredoxin protein